MEIETDSADKAVITVGQLTSLLQNYTAMSVRPMCFLPLCSLRRPMRWLGRSHNTQ